MWLSTWQIMKKFIIKSNQNFETVYHFYAFIICRRSENFMFT